MGRHGSKATEENGSTESSPLMLSAAVPKDHYNIAYLTFFILGAGILLPWNSFISAVDYFDVLYPFTHTDRVFALAYMIPCLIVLVLLTFYGQQYTSRSRINLGFLTYLAVFVFVPLMDEVWITGDRGTKVTHYLTVASALVLGIADALVQASLVGSAGELPERYMQSLIAGTAASGVVASVLRVITKAGLPQTTEGLRLSADLYFAVTAIFMLICLISYNMVYKLPIMLHYNSVKIGAMESNGQPQDVSELGLATNTTDVSLMNKDMSFAHPVSYRHVWGQIQWLAIAVGVVYAVTLSIFPGFITEDVHSVYMGDWYPILLIGTYNVADLLGKVVTSYSMMENQLLLIRCCFGRVLFFPVFYLVLYGPAFFRLEALVFLFTFSLGLSNGYLTSNLMILAPKNVPILESETAGIIMVVFLLGGLSCGSILGWVWVI